jgi:hypothetical protein
MVKEELIQRSPVGFFMKSIHGGLTQGELGVIASLSGLGKTSVLVQIAMDKLLQGKKVIHVSFNQHTDYVLAWYEDIFNEFIKKKNLEHEDDIKTDLVKNRVLMKFNQEGLTVDQILKSLRAMIRDGGFAAECVIVDGYRFTPQEGVQISKIKDFAKELGLSVWFSCTVSEGQDPRDQSPQAQGPYDKHNIPVILKDYAELFEVIVVLEPKQDHIRLAVSRNFHSRGSAVERTTPGEGSHPEHSALKLDPKTLLILEE